MTIETYKKAHELIKEIEEVSGKMSDLREIMSKDYGNWMMEVRPTPSFSSFKIDHCGLLPEFLKAVYEKHLEKVESLKKELAEL